MTFGIELRPISPGASGGIAMVLAGVLPRLFRQFPQDQFHVFATIFSRGLLEGAQAPNVQFHSLPTRTFFRDMDQVIHREKITALFRAYPVSDTSTFPLSRQVVCIPDVQHEDRPEFFDPGVLRCRRTAFNRFLEHAGAIGTISSHARRQILDLPMTRCRDVFLMPPSLTEQHRPVTEADLTAAELAQVPREPFFYFPANLWTHKNHVRLLEAFEQVRRQVNQPVRLVLTGHPEGFERLRDRFPGAPVTHLGFVRPQLVRLLLQRATALTFFSQYEGFGIPLLEAFSAGCPVLCSNTTSLPEVAGDAALLVDPTDVAAMATAMLAMLNDPALRRDLVQKGAQRLGAWTWEASAEQVHAALVRVAAAPAPNEPIAAPQTVAPARRGGFARLKGVYETYWHEKGFTIPRAWREIRRRARPLLFGSPVLNRLAMRSRAAARLLDRLNPVRGVRADNSLAPLTRIVVGESLEGREWCLCGTASADGVLEILSGSEPMMRHPLEKGRRTCLRFVLPAGGSCALTLRLQGGGGFVLDQTNLFTEEQIY